MAFLRKTSNHKKQYNQVALTETSLSNPHEGHDDWWLTDHSDYWTLMLWEKEVKDIEITAFHFSNTCKVVNGNDFQIELSLPASFEIVSLQFPIKGVVKEGINRVKERSTQVKVADQRSCQNQNQFKKISFKPKIMEIRADVKLSRDQLKKGIWVKSKRKWSQVKAEISFQSKMMSKPGWDWFKDQVKSKRRSVTDKDHANVKS